MASATLNYELKTEDADGVAIARQHRVRWVPGVGNGKRESISCTGAAFVALSPPTGSKAVALILPITAVSLTLKGVTGDTGIALTPSSLFAGIDAFFPLGSSPSIGIANAGSTVVIEVLWF